MKKIFVKPAVDLVNAETANMICASALSIGSGTAEQAQGNGWTLNAKQGGISTISRGSSWAMGKMEF